MQCFFMESDRSVVQADLKADENNEIFFKNGLYCIREGGTFLITEEGKHYQRAAFWKVGNPNPFNFTEVNKGIPAKVINALMEPRIWRMLATGDEHPYLVAIIVLSVIILVFNIALMGIIYGKPWG